MTLFGHRPTLNTRQGVGRKKEGGNGRVGEVGKVEIKEGGGRVRSITRRKGKGRSIYRRKGKGRSRYRRKGKGRSR